MIWDTLYLQGLDTFQVRTSFKMLDIEYRHLAPPRPGYLLLVSCLLSQEFLCPEPITETMPGPGREIFAAKWRGAFLVML